MDTYLVNDKAEAEIQIYLTEVFYHGRLGPFCQIFFFFIKIFFCFGHATQHVGFLVLGQELDLCSLHWKHGGSTT